MAGGDRARSRYAVYRGRSSGARAGWRRSAASLPTSRTQRVLGLAKDSAQALGEREVGAEHLLVGVLREAKGAGGQVLLHHGLSEAATLDAIKRIKRGGEHARDLRWVVGSYTE